MVPRTDVNRKNHDMEVVKHMCGIMTILKNVTDECGRQVCCNVLCR